MKFDFESEIIKTAKKYLPDIPDEEIERKFRGVLWKKTKSNTILLLKDSYDYTIFIGGTEGSEIEYTEEKSLILSDMYDYIETVYSDIEIEIDKAITKFKSKYDDPKFIKIFPEIIDLIIARNNLGILPSEPLELKLLNVRNSTYEDVSGVSDTKSFEKTEDVENIEKKALSLEEI